MGHGVHVGLARRRRRRGSWSLRGDPGSRRPFRARDSAGRPHLRRAPPRSSRRDRARPGYAPRIASGHGGAGAAPRGRCVAGDSRGHPVGVRRRGESRRHAAAGGGVDSRQAPDRRERADEDAFAPSPGSSPSADRHELHRLDPEGVVDVWTPPPIASPPVRGHPRGAPSAIATSPTIEDDLDVALGGEAAPDVFEEGGIVARNDHDVSGLPLVAPWHSCHVSPIRIHHHGSSGTHYKRLRKFATGDYRCTRPAVLAKTTNMGT